MRHLLPLQYIDAVARTGSIRRAAETLNLTSTALNRRILAMEEELLGRRQRSKRMRMRRRMTWDTRAS